MHHLLKIAFAEINSMADITNCLIISRATERIAEIFHLEVKSVKMEMVFDRDFSGSKPSDFKWNEFDRVFHDIRDVASKKVLHEINSGVLTIRTVDDYCNHMIRCYQENAVEVVRLLKLGA